MASMYKSIGNAANSVSTAFTRLLKMISQYGMMRVGEKRNIERKTNLSLRPPIFFMNAIASVVLNLPSEPSEIVSSIPPRT